MIWILRKDGSIIQGQFSSELTRKHTSMVTTSPYPLYSYVPSDEVEKTFDNPLAPSVCQCGYEIRPRPEFNGRLSLRQVLTYSDGGGVLGAEEKVSASSLYSSPDRNTCAILLEMTSSARASVPSPFLKPLCPYPHYDAKLTLEAYKAARKIILALIQSNLSPEDIEATIKQAYPHLGYFLDYWEGIKLSSQNSYSFDANQVETTIESWKELGKDDSRLHVRDREVLSAYCAAQVNTQALKLIDIVHARCRRKM